MTLQNLTFNRDDSMVIRGVAILAMVCHHALPSPVCKICVGLFTFLVGYGYYFNRPPEWRNNLRRAWRLLSSYWLILFILIVPSSCIVRGYLPSFSETICNAFGLEETLNSFSWYVAFYVYAMIMMPLYSRLIRIYPYIGTMAIISVSLVMCVLLHYFVPARHTDMWWNALLCESLYTPLLAVGFLFAQKQYIQRIQLPVSGLSGIGAVALTVLVFIVRELMPYIPIDILLVPVLVVAVLWLKQCWPITRFWNVDMIIGHQSMNIWFLHSLFFTASTASIWYPFISWIPNGFLQIVWIIILCYPIGVCIDKLHAFILANWGRLAGILQLYNRHSS